MGKLGECEGAFRSGFFRWCNHRFEKYKTRYCCWMLKQLNSMCNYIIMICCIYDVHFVPWCVAAIFASWLDSKFKHFFAWTPEAVAIWFGSSPAPTTQCWRRVPAQRWFLVTRMRWHYAMLGPQWCRYGSIPLPFFLDEHPELQFMFGVNRRNQKGARVLSHSCKDVFLLMTSI